MSAFKAYDIRGIYNKDFDKETAYKIGFFLKDLFNAEEIAVGRDGRNSSEEIFEYLSKGITDSGCNVADIGLATTPMTYYASFKKGFATAVMITASHNPKNYNGFKITGPDGIPVGGESGLAKLEEWVNGCEIIPKVKKGTVSKLDIKDEYADFLKEHLNDISNLKFAVDCACGTSSLIVKKIFGDAPIYLNSEIDGDFKAHSPNPMLESSRKELKKCVKDNCLDVGIIYDGDADRVMFLDEKGRFISPDLIICLLANYLIDEVNQNAVIDIRSSKSVYYYLKELSAVPHIWKVGHAYAKKKLRELDAVLGGELAGHYYFRDFGFCDSGILASIIVLNVLSEFKEDGIAFSDLIKEFSLFASSGELNFKVENKEQIINSIKEKYSKEDYVKFYDFDGIRFDFEDWWFNLRASNTEPYLRLVCEAKDKNLLKQKTDELREIIIN